MKTIEIIGDNYFGAWKRTRTACRGIVIRGEQLLMSLESASDLWMLPGGGLQVDESDTECCAREILQETGNVVRPAACQLQINEYYEDWKWVNRYFLCSVTGTGQCSLTDRQKEAALVPRWLPIKDALAIFAKHQSYAETDEPRRGIYLRELTALTELEEQIRQFAAGRAE